MNLLRTCMIALSTVLCGVSSIALASDPPEITSVQPESPRLEGRYSGTWLTTKSKKLDGTANCEIKQLARDRWQGRFWGMWQHVPFDYTVEFGRATPGENGDIAAKEMERNIRYIANIPETLVAGKATIDGTRYDWTGKLDQDHFNIRFTGSRYDGHLELTKVKDEKP